MDGANLRSRPVLRPADVVAIEDEWFDEKGILKYTASKNQQMIELEDETGALAETVQWLRRFKRDQNKVSKYLCVYPEYMGRRMYSRDRVSASMISRYWTQHVELAGYSKGEFQFKDLRKKSLAYDPGANKGGHKTQAMQDYYESVKARPVRTKNRLKAVR